MRFLSRNDRDPPPVRARRHRRFQRRVTYGTAALVAVATLTGGSWYAARTGLVARSLAPFQAGIARETRELDLTVQSVEVIGRHRTARQAILDALGSRRGTPILEVDLAAAQTRLESLPWVRSAAVERLLPDTIFVRLVEHQPLAVWQDHGHFAVIDQAGGIIPEARAADFPRLPQLVGDGAAAAAPEFVEMIESEPDLARHVAAAVRVGGRRWNVQLDDGIEIALPAINPGTAWHRLAALDRNDRLLERQISEVDMRLPDRLVLRLPHDTAKAIIKKPPPARPNA